MTPDICEKARTQSRYSEPVHTRDRNPADHTDGGKGTPSASCDDHQIGLLEGQWTPPAPLPEGTYTLVVTESSGPLGGQPHRPTFIGVTVTVADGPDAGRSFEQKVFRGVTNYGEVQRLVTATDLARAIEGPDAPTRTFKEAAQVIEQAMKQRLPFRAKVTWGAMDRAALEQRAGKPCNARGLSMIWGADKFDRVDEYGQPAARGIDGQLLRPQPYITRFLKRLKASAGAGPDEEPK